MSFRRGGDDISVAELDIGNRATTPGRTVVVMVHGFCADEVPFIRMAPGEPGYGARLAEELGASVVYVRYNTGLHISDNGKALSRLLDAMLTRYADDIDQVVLVGHSMGGLVCRSAGHYGHRQSAAWLRKHTVQVLIGVPMMGSYLEQGANIASLVLRRIPNLHTRLLGRLLDGRSAGTKDLRTGSMRHEDWHGALPGDTGLDADLATLLARRHPVALLDGVDYHIVVGTLAGGEAHPLAVFLGDGLITGKSASGKGLFAPDDPVATRGSLTVISKVTHPQTLFSQAIGSHVVGVVGRYVPSSG